VFFANAASYREKRAAADVNTANSNAATLVTSIAADVIDTVRDNTLVGDVVGRDRNRSARKSEAATAACDVNAVVFDVNAANRIAAT
jgi:hypothetical protein